MRKPYWVKRLKCWYVKDANRREVRLDPDRQTALQMWHEWQASTISEGESATVLGLLDAFFDEIDSTISPTRMAALTYYASCFAMDHGSDLAQQLKRSTVVKWLNAPKPGRKRKDASAEPNPVQWSKSSQRHAAAFLKRVFRWAHNQGRIQVNPIADLKLPECEYRDTVIDFGTHTKLVQHLRETENARPFALYLIASRCGARPQQIREVTAAHVSRDGTQWVFKQHKTRAKTGKPLVVYLPPCLQTLTRILMASHPSGPLFRNAMGKGGSPTPLHSEWRGLGND